MFKDLISRNGFGNTVNDGAESGGIVAVAYAGNLVQDIDLATGQPVDDPIATANSANAVTFLTATKLAVLSFNVQTPFKVDLVARTSTTLGTANYSRYATKGQTIAGNISLGQALGAGFNSGTIVKVDDSSGASSMTPTQLSGTNASAVIVKPGSNNWMVGSENGKVFEMDFGGTDVANVTLPVAASQAGTRSNNGVASMTMVGDLLFVATANGLVYIYDWSGPTYLATWTLGKNTSLSGGVGQILSNIANGQFMYCCGMGASELNANISLWDTAVSPYANIDNRAAFGVGDILGLGLVPSLNQGWALFGGTTELVTFGMNSLNTGTITTRAQNPGDVSHRSILLQSIHAGMSRVEADATISSGEQPITTNFSGGVRYEEISDISTTFEVRQGEV